MAKYRKKPVEVEATQWYPNVPVKGVRIQTTFADNCSIPMFTATVVTIHGQETLVSPGDWIITEPDGIHHYPCKPDVFQASYEPV